MDIMKDFRKEIHNFEVRTWTTVFVLLKALGVISWNWIWVLCPFWIDLMFVIILEYIKFRIKKKKSKTMFS